MGTSLVFLAPFDVIATVAGTYLLMLNFSSSAPASLEIYVDGVASPETAATVGTFGSTSSVAMVSLSANDHLNLVNTSGGFEQIDSGQLTIIRLQ